MDPATRDRDTDDPTHVPAQRLPPVESAPSERRLCPPERGGACSLMRWFPRRLCPASPSDLGRQDQRCHKRTMHPDPGVGVPGVSRPPAVGAPAGNTAATDRAPGTFWRVSLCPCPCHRLVFCVGAITGGGRRQGEASTNGPPRVSQGPGRCPTTLQGPQVPWLPWVDLIRVTKIPPKPILISCPFSLFLLFS